jgi:hypothetical protein
METTVEVDFYDSKQQLDYITNKITIIEFTTRELRSIDDKLYHLSKKIAEIEIMLKKDITRKDKLFKRELIIFAVVSVFLAVIKY